MTIDASFVTIAKKRQTNHDIKDMFTKKYLYPIESIKQNDLTSSLRSDINSYGVTTKNLQTDVTKAVSLFEILKSNTKLSMHYQLFENCDPVVLSEQ